MARPKRDLFYDREENAEFYLAQDWLSTYDRNSRNVVDYLVQRDVGTTLYYCTIRCLEMFRRFLMENGHCYTAGAAIQWFRDTGPYPKGSLSALLRLDDFFQYGDIQPIHAFPIAVPHYACLYEPWKSLLDAYLLTLDQKRALINTGKELHCKILIQHPVLWYHNAVGDYVSAIGIIYKRGCPQIPQFRCPVYLCDWRHSPLHGI